MIELLEKYDDECLPEESNPEDRTPEDREDDGMPAVSYTHLTLPTIYSV